MTYGVLFVPRLPGTSGCSGPVTGVEPTRHMAPLCDFMCSLGPKSYHELSESLFVLHL